MCLWNGQTTPNLDGVGSEFGISRPCLFVPNPWRFLANMRHADDGHTNALRSEAGSLLALLYSGHLSAFLKAREMLHGTITHLCMVS